MVAKTLEVYKTGTWVRLSDDVEAKIITVALHQGDIVQYECAWWSGEWLAAACSQYWCVSSTTEYYDAFT